MPQKTNHGLYRMLKSVSDGESQDMSATASGKKLTVVIPARFGRALEIKAKDKLECTLDLKNRRLIYEEKETKK
ncbi:MAG: AbrB/MazE/SpoVT family DNA-binding domain-containing protein [Candidatus Heimdallarchaeota archaeon]|nr:AbrB/MazE/SpoVT family DNA-binding domain-containing protein [Candidatus Heimdallarchaeota archaeon]